jgi:hypothetical protein
MSTNYRRNRRATIGRSSSGAGSRWMNLRFAAPCKVCGSPVPAGGRGFWDAAARAVTCSAIDCAKADGLTTQQWQGSPVRGQYVTVLSSRRIGDVAPSDPFSKTRSRGYFGRDAGRCEDAPCCGCCD